MKIKFPRNVVVDTDNIPQDFEEQIRASFEAYTEGTAEAYTYQDKLAYIDVCRKLLHRAKDTSDCVLALMKEYLVPCGCGGKAETHELFGEYSGTYMTDCKECGTGTTQYSTKKESRDAWNTAMGRASE